MCGLEFCLKVGSFRTRRGGEKENSHRNFHPRWGVGGYLCSSVIRMEKIVSYFSQSLLTFSFGLKTKKTIGRLLPSFRVFRVALRLFAQNRRKTMIAEHPVVPSSYLPSSLLRDDDVDDGNCTVTSGAQTVRHSNVSPHLKQKVRRFLPNIPCHAAERRVENSLLLYETTKRFEFLLVHFFPLITYFDIFSTFQRWTLPNS